MSDRLWYQLPTGFLKKKAKGWLKLDYDVRALVVELARAQNFKCAFCDKTKNLIIEHDHWPERGSGDKLTVYNIRGLVCSRCNWHLGMHEADARGDYRGWDNAFIHISERDFEPYAYAYDCRILALFDEELKQTLPPRIYWRRYFLLEKFDDWNEWGRQHYPWRSYFAEIKERRRWIIRTPEQCLTALAACTRFIVEQIEKNPDFEIPEQFLQIIAQLQPIIEEIWPQIEERYWALKAEKQSKLLLPAP